MEEFANSVVELINLERTENGVDPLRVDAQLSQVAQEHSASMATEDYFSTQNLEGLSFAERLFNAGYGFTLAGEAIGAGYSTPEALVEGWLSNPGIESNILNPEFTEIGVGYEFLANDTGNVNFNNYWTADFGTPV